MRVYNAQLEPLNALLCKLVKSSAVVRFRSAPPRDTGKALIETEEEIDCSTRRMAKHC